MSHGADEATFQAVVIETARLAGWRCAHFVLLGRKRAGGYRSRPMGKAGRISF